MVLQILADAGKRVDDRNAELPQQRGRPDAGQLQQLRRLQRARGQDHFAPCASPSRRARPGDRRRPTPCVRRTGSGSRARRSRSRRLRPRSRGSQIRGRGRAAQAVARRELVVADAFLRRAVEVVVARNAELAAGLDDRFDQLVLRADVGAHSGPSAPCHSFGAANVVLELAKVRQHVVVAPAGVAERRPVVVVLALPADVDEPVDRARAAERAPARPVDLAARSFPDRARS